MSKLIDFDTDKCERSATLTWGLIEPDQDWSCEQDDSRYNNRALPSINGIGVGVGLGVDVDVVEHNELEISNRRKFDWSRNRTAYERRNYQGCDSPYCN